jgi:hypothetical protein
MVQLSKYFDLWLAPFLLSNEICLGTSSYAILVKFLFIIY